MFLYLYCNYPNSLKGRSKELFENLLKVITPLKKKKSQISLILLIAPSIQNFQCLNIYVSYNCTELEFPRIRPKTRIGVQVIDLGGGQVRQGRKVTKGYISEQVTALSKWISRLLATSGSLQRTGLRDVSTKGPRSWATGPAPVS